MQNVKTSVKGNKLTIEIDISQEFGLSSSGKTIIIGSTKGNKEIEGTDGVILGLNAYKYANTKK